MMWLMDLAAALSAFAALVSAVGGAAAAVAAFRSAGSATAALRAAREAEKRANLREIASTAAALAVEVERVQLRTNDLLIEYRDAEIFSGSREHTGFKELRDQVNASASKATDLGSSAAPFLEGAKSLRDAPLDEIDRVQLRLSQALVNVRAIREELQGKHASVSKENFAQRERRLNAR